MNEITTFSANVPASFSFKSDKLNEASAKIAVELVKMNTVAEGVLDAKESFNRAVSPILAEVMEDKLYKADGFASVADYAEQTFSLKRSFAYMLARVGKRVKTLPELSSFTTSNAAELVNADGKAVQDAIASGELDEYSTQQQLREFAIAHPVKTPKAKIVPKFDFFKYGTDEMVLENESLDVVLGDLTGFKCFKAPKEFAANCIVAFDSTSYAAQILVYKPHEVKASGTPAKFRERLESDWRAGRISDDDYIAALKASYEERGKEA